MTSREIVFRVRVVRDVSCVRSCGCEMCLWCRGVFRIRVFLLLLLLQLLCSVALLVSRHCPFHFSFLFLFTLFFMFFILSAAMRFRVAATLASSLASRQNSTGAMTRSFVKVPRAHQCQSSRTPTPLRLDRLQRAVKETGPLSSREVDRVADNSHDEKGPEMVGDDAKKGSISIR